MYRFKTCVAAFLILAAPMPARADALGNLVEFAVTQGITSGVGPQWETITRSSIPVINEGKLDAYSAKVGFTTFQNRAAFTISLENLSNAECINLSRRLINHHIPVAVDINGTIVPTRTEVPAYSPDWCSRSSPAKLVIIAN